MKRLGILVLVIFFASLGLVFAGGNSDKSGRSSSTQRKSNNYDTYEKEGYVAFKANDYVKAIGAYTKAMEALGELPPKDSSLYKDKLSKSLELYANRGLAYYKAGNTEDAKKDLTIALYQYADYKDERNFFFAAPEWAEVFVRLAPVSSAYEAFQRGEEAYKANKYDLAIEEFTKAIELAPDYTEAYYQRGHCYYRKGNREQTEKDYNEVIRISEEFPADAKDYNLKRAYYSLGAINQNSRDYTKAMSYYQAALKIDNYYKPVLDQIKNINIQQLFGLANAVRDKNDYSAAIAQYREILQIDPNHSGAKTNLKLVWDKRIAENSKIYPAPFEGKWQYYRPAETITIPGIPGTPSRTYTSYESYDAPTGSWNNGNWRPGYQRSTRAVTRTDPGRPGTPDRTITTPEVNYVYEFQGNNYILTTATGTKTTGTFYYNGEKIELDNGTILQFSNNTVSSEIDVIDSSLKIIKTKVDFSKQAVTVSAFAQQYDPESDFTVTKQANGKSVAITKYIGSKQAVNIPPTIQGLPVTSIRDYAFQKCTSLTNVTIPNGVTSIGNYAFGSCTSLASVTIPNSVTTIGNHAFDSCTSLASVTIPDSVSSIGNSAFEGTAWLNNQPDGLVYAGKVAYIYKGAMPANTRITIINGTKGIANCAFYNCNGLTSITIPSSVTSIGNFAFSGCNSLTSVTIPNSVTSIGEFTFSGCNGLTSVTIPVGVTSIGAAAFSDCTGLTSITIPNSVRSIGNSAFQGCSGLKIVTIPNSVTSIATQAFSGCSSLTSVTIGNGVTRIGDRAFVGCSSLTAINADAGNSAYTAENGVLYNKNKTILVLYPAGKTGSFTIPAGVTSIGLAAFRDCIGLTSVTIPNSVTSIDIEAFTSCSGLTGVTIPDSVTSIGGFAFSDCTGLTSVTIPNSVTSIGEGAFIRCTSLTSVTIGNGVTTIGEAAFSGTGLTSVTFQGTITSMNFAAGSSYPTFHGDLRAKYLAGGIGTYTRPNSSSTTWTKK